LPDAPVRDRSTGIPRIRFKRISEGEESGSLRKRSITQVHFGLLRLDMPECRTSRQID